MHMKKQFGRSMIEMLAVLAIIGVLSIGDVWGYRKAVTKHLANNVIDDIYLSGFLIMDELFNRLPDDDVGMDMTGKFDQKSPYTFKAFAETASTFEILVQNVPYDVCQELIERELKDLDEVRANGFDKECFSDRTNEVSFFFSTDPTSDHCLQDSDCGHCSECINHRCRYGFEDNDENCFFCDDSTISITNVDKDECHRCKNRKWRTASSGRCESCEDTDNWRSWYSYDECMRCPNRGFLGNPNDLGHCWQCSGKIDPVTGKCDTIKCDYPDFRIYGVTRNLCNQCSNRFFSISAAACVKCLTEAFSFEGVTFEDCMKCPHQSWTGTNLNSGTCSYCAGTVNKTTGECTE